MEVTTLSAIDPSYSYICTGPLPNSLLLTYEDRIVFCDYLNGEIFDVLNVRASCAVPCGVRGIAYIVCENAPCIKYASLASGDCPKITPESSDSEIYADLIAGSPSSRVLLAARRDGALALVDTRDMKIYTIDLGSESHKVLSFDHFDSLTLSLSPVHAEGADQLVVSLVSTAGSLCVGVVPDTLSGGFTVLYETMRTASQPAHALPLRALPLILTPCVAASGTDLQVMDGDNTTLIQLNDTVTIECAAPVCFASTYTLFTLLTSPQGLAAVAFSHGGHPVASAPLHGIAVPATFLPLAPAPAPAASALVVDHAGAVVLVSSTVAPFDAGAARVATRDAVTYLRNCTISNEVVVGGMVWRDRMTGFYNDLSQGKVDLELASEIVNNVEEFYRQIHAIDVSTTALVACAAALALTTTQCTESATFLWKQLLTRAAPLPALARALRALASSLTSERVLALSAALIAGTCAGEQPLDESVQATGAWLAAAASTVELTPVTTQIIRMSIDLLSGLSAGAAAAAAAAAVLVPVRGQGQLAPLTDYLVTKVSL